MRRLAAPIDERPPDFEGETAESVLEYLVERFHPRLYVACSFQKEASVIMDMLLRIEPSARFFTLDTDVLFDETHETWRALEAKYDISIDVYRGISLEAQAAQHGDALWAREPDKCCGIRKVTPLKHALSDVDAWVAGLRREQSSSRRSAKKIDWDLRHGLWKANPLADWTEREVWDYIARHDVPYNKLHDRGYPSIGCTHCTLPASEGREGRWADADKTECGLH
ncbi:MAG: phosphoadenosine phosphosulfate reductase [Thermoleophilaceae bacterium]|nr:phosphoadenosine phosphosulfate reductase [Thermoleophilaceae bacterium]